MCLSKIHFHRGGVPIIDSLDANFSIGSRSMIVGENGAGTTSLVRITVKFNHLLYRYPCAFPVALNSACSSTRYCLELPQPDATSHPSPRSWVGSVSVLPIATGTPLQIRPRMKALALRWPDAGIFSLCPKVRSSLTYHDRPLITPRSRRTSSSSR